MVTQVVIYKVDTQEQNSIANPTYTPQKSYNVLSKFMIWVRATFEAILGFLRPMG